VPRKKSQRDHCGSAGKAEQQQLHYSHSTGKLLERQLSSLHYSPPPFLQRQHSGPGFLQIDDNQSAGGEGCFVLTEGGDYHMPNVFWQDTLTPHLQTLGPLA
jgi:hypothetical protein